MMEIEISLTFTTPPNIGSGARIDTFADRAFIKDREGWPYIPASALKGQLRHAVERVARSLGQTDCITHQKMCQEAESCCPICAIFGSPWIPGSLRFVDCPLTGPPEIVALKERSAEQPNGFSRPVSSQRYGVALSRRRKVAEDAHLYTTELFMPGASLIFSAVLRGDIRVLEAALIVAGARLLPAIGRSKSTGLGHLTAEASVTQDGQRLDRAALRAALDEVIS